MQQHTSDDDTNTVRPEQPECFASPPVVEVGSGSDVEVMKVGINWTSMTKFPKESKSNFLLAFQTVARETPEARQQRSTF